MNKYKIAHYLRRMGIINILDKLRYYITLLTTYSKRSDFLLKNKGVKLPPAYFIYETFNLNYFGFYNQSIETARWLVSYFEKYKKLENVKILDWGCGPGRLIRHLPEFVSDSCDLYGTDYNQKYVKWCSGNIQGVTFRQNNLNPPLDFEDEYFDIIYGISIFTHLSEEMHFRWFEELMRVLRKGGIIFLTLHGDSFKVQLTGLEISNYDLGKLVVKANTKEGHRTFGAFHPVSFVYKLAGAHKVLEHVPGITSEGRPQQDIWIFQKS